MWTAVPAVALLGGLDEDRWQKPNAAARAAKVRQRHIGDQAEDLQRMNGLLD